MIREPGRVPVLSFSVHRHICISLFLGGALESTLVGGSIARPDFPFARITCARLGAVGLVEMTFGWHRTLCSRNVGYPLGSANMVPTVGDIAKSVLALGRSNKQ